MLCDHSGPTPGMPPIEDRGPRQSTGIKERPLLATSVGLVFVHVPCCVTTQGPHQPCTPCLRNCDHTRCETARVNSDTICNDPPRSLGPQEYPHRPTHVFPTHFVLTHVHPGRTSRSVTHCSRSSMLNFGVFGDGFWKRSCHSLV
jgi:hypothetical protein